MSNQSQTIIFLSFLLSMLFTHFIKFVSFRFFLVLVLQIQEVLFHPWELQGGSEVKDYNRKLKKWKKKVLNQLYNNCFPGPVFCNGTKLGHRRANNVLIPTVLMLGVALHLIIFTNMEINLDSQSISLLLLCALKYY